VSVLRVPFVDLAAARAELDGAIEQAVTRVATSDRYVLGDEVSAFEAEFAHYCGSRFCVGVGNGLDALTLALRAVGVGVGDEVIVPAYTFIATWLAVTQVGAVPVPVEVRPDTYNIDPAAAGRAITERTKAVIPVHLFGQPADMEPVVALAREAGAAVVEDAAQAHGARYDGRHTGSLGDVAAFSFYPPKNLGALGDGGAVTTDDPEVLERVRLLRNYGSTTKYDHRELGVNSRLDEIQAAVLRAKLPRLDDWNTRRAEIAERYLELLADVPGLHLPVTQSRVESVWHLFVVRHPARDEIRAALAKHGVETLVHYPIPPHQSRAYRHLSLRTDLSETEQLAATSLSLPMHPHLSRDQVDVVVTELARATEAALA
jgi:dTDP-3-amino-3,4,6-trideoxy-alpha-D-glucose transaminase